jgi:aminoglycoside phosphotransferase (APT) family kinase protein
MPAPDRADLIGKGFCADVYAWGAECVLKLFHDPGACDRADREFAATRAVHSAGLPVPAAYERVEVEGRPGIVFERVRGVSLLGHTQKRPWNLFAAIRLAAELHAGLHRCTAPPGLPSLRERIGERIDRSPAPVVQKRAARARLAALPDGEALCHGDFHPDNVLLTARGPVVIDWSSAGRGHPAGDLACTSRLLRTAGLPPWAPWHAHLMLRCLRPVMHRAYLAHYFRRHDGSRREVERWQLPLAVAAQAPPARLT